jgi:4-cresol dehydrogenase (hydroxylating)
MTNLLPADTSAMAASTASDNTDASPLPVVTELTPEAIARFTDILGHEGVLLTEVERDTFRDPYWHHDDRTYDTSAVLLPRTTAEVQAVVKIAAEFDLPIWTSSQGRNYGYGGPSPRVRGSLAMNFTRMNKVLEINSKLAYAVVEPGVRWFDLHEALIAGGHDDLMVSVPDLGWGSVVGNSLDNGVTYLPQGSDFQAPCGMEIVLANGELLRTGMGAMPGNESWHLYKRGLGPVLDPLFIQSNYGIVTQMGYWLMKKPETYAPLFLTIPHHDQLGQAIDIVRELRMDGVIRGVPVIQNTLTLASHFVELLGQFAGAEGVWPESDLQKLADQSGMGRWGLRTAVWGDSAVVELQVKKLKDAWRAIEGSAVHSEGRFGAENWGDISTFTDKVQAGIPNLDMLDAFPPDMGHIGFSPVVPLLGEKVTEVVDFLTEIVSGEAKLNFAAGILVINDRSCIVVSGLNFDTKDAETTAAAYVTAKEMVREAGRRGYGEYRAHIDFMDEAADQYSFNDYAYRRFCEAIKDAIDPQGILSPGRHGIWPARYRKAQP